MIAQPRNGHGFAHRRIGLIGPFDASASGAERVNDAGRAAHEDVAVQDGGLRVGGDVAIESEGPFEFELAHLADGEPGCARGLEARVVECGTPSVPGKPGSWAKVDGAL